LNVFAYSTGKNIITGIFTKSGNKLQRSTQKSVIIYLKNYLSVISFVG